MRGLGLAALSLLLISLRHGAGLFSSRHFHLRFVSHGGGTERFAFPRQYAMVGIATATRNSRS